MLRHLAIPTRGDGAAVTRCLEAVASHGSTRARAVHATVLDDGRDELLGDRLARTASDLDLGISYVGREAKRRAIHRCSTELGVDPELLRWGLLPEGAHTRAGANRSWAALLHAGERFWSLDDDFDAGDVLEWTQWESPAAEIPDPTQLWLERGDAERDGWCPTGADPWEAHDAMLSSRADELVDRDAIAHPSTRLVITGATPVVASWTGFHGGPGTESPWYLIGPGERSRRRLAVGDARYLACWERPWLLRGVTRPTVSAGFAMQPGSVAYDGEVTLPPFMPIFRGQGQVFTAALRACSIGAVGYLPLTLGHRDRSAPFHLGDVEPMARPSMADILKVRIYALEVESSSPLTLDGLGEALERFDEPTLGFCARARREALRAHIDRLAALSGPDAWRSALAACRRAVADTPFDARPRELGGARATDDALRWVRRFGSWLRCWPTLWEAARAGAFRTWVGHSAASRAGGHRDRA